MKIGVIGLGYVGLPVSVLFSKKYKVLGYDINNHRIDTLNNYNDETLEVSKKVLKKSLNGNFKITKQLNDLKVCNFYIITVPTPILKNKEPDLSPLINSTSSVGSLISKGDIVVYESTVYPGCTEEVCVPILEKISGLKYNKDFYCGYSPERINPGDKKHTIDKILKVTSGSTPEIAKTVDRIYNSVLSAGTFKVSSIKIAEAAKVIENTQRDINIAFINELAMLFNKLDIDTTEVLKAASTKWNFLDFKPGLVGGHCIGVDPYYLATKALQHGIKPEIILAGRKVNDEMGNFIASQIILKLNQLNKEITNCSILILGVTFKENCPDFRNTKVIDLIKQFKKSANEVDLYDPWVDSKSFKSHYKYKVLSKLPQKKYDVIILAVSHEAFRNLDIKQLVKDDRALLYDIKSFFKKSKISYVYDRL